MRTAFINQLIDDAAANDKLFLLVGDLGYSVVEPFAERFPDRYLNVGIAEQNMAGIAAGLAMAGYCVYIYSIGNFPTLRCMEQIRYDICYHNLNVKIVAVGGGYAYGSLGASHHATEEIGMLRTIPNMVVCAPGDPNEAKAVTTFCSNHTGPCYIRLGKAGEPIVHQQSLSLRSGDILTISRGSSGVALFSTGAMLKYSLDFITQHAVDVSLYSFPFVSPIREELLIAILEEHKQIITIEEHQANGGFGSAILEQINNLQAKGLFREFIQVKRIAIPNQFYSVAGSQEFLRDHAGVVLNLSDFSK